MPISRITASSKPISPHKSFSSPDFKAKAAHVSGRFQFVEMWLRQGDAECRKALVYWKQAENFYKANEAVDELAKPLTSYYCMLNMCKALLVCKGQDMASVQHGVSGYSIGQKTALSNEIVKFKFSGVLPSLSKFFEEPVAGTDEHNLSDLLYNLPHIHRAYCMTIPSRKNRELFIPLYDCGFFRVGGTGETYFRGSLTRGWNVGRTKKKLPKGFEVDPHSEIGELSVRKKKRFKWSGASETKKIQNLQKYHRKLRKEIFQIYDSPDCWYLKRSGDPEATDGVINKAPTVIAFAALHRLSELSRYDPDKLSRHFNNRYGWLLSEFLGRTLDQVLDDLTSEITGYEVQ
ncbi:YaaC family protein [Ruegeria aquimaris]|uniref:YaaC family protein n=1 Tax=Ruegeria aquimaris TaxID=2984333 RepID=A0ABT3ARF9_9RHOB|nr:YaaC family protein [Ruegeria sp. XHP0148]MCV2891276.1 YaaC family protein [Ruegeria sp. XHP0148]